MVNRSWYFSSDIQMFEKLSTFAEINRTVMENIIPRGSIIIVKIIGVCVRDIIFHSSSSVLQVITILIVGIAINSMIDQINLLAQRKIEYFGIENIIQYNFTWQLLMVKLRVNLQQYACLGTHPHQLVNYFPPLLFTHVLKNARRQANRHDFGQFALIFGEAPKKFLGCCLLGQHKQCC